MNKTIGERLYRLSHSRHVCHFYKLKTQGVTMTCITIDINGGTPVRKYLKIIFP